MSSRPTPPPVVAIRNIIEAYRLTPSGFPTAEWPYSEWPDTDIECISDYVAAALGTGISWSIPAAMLTDGRTTTRMTFAGGYGSSQATRFSVCPLFW